MLSNVTLLATPAGAALTAYQAYQQDDRWIVILSAVGGFAFSIFLQLVAGKFSKEEKSLKTRVGQVLVGDFATALSGIILPVTVAYGYVKKNGDTISKTSLGLFQIEPTITLRGRDVTHLYPGLVGANIGFLFGQMVGKFLSHFW
jgi:hypothetical protein